MRKVRVLLSMTALLLAVSGATAIAQSSDDQIRSEIEALKSGQDQIRKDLAEIKKLIQARPAAPVRPAGPNVVDKVFDLRDNPVEGASTAKLTLVEFTDYQ